MTGSKREALKQRILDAAEARIRDHGLKMLRARDVTNDAGCALGSLYNAFEDLDLLVLGVNSRTLDRLEAALRAASEGAEGPEAQLRALAHAYRGFASENPHLWAALFDHRMPEGVPVPDWHIEEHRPLIAMVMAPLGALVPDLTGDMLAIRARTLFSAVHGIVKLALEDRFVALPPDLLAAELDTFLAAQLRGATG